MPPTGPLGRIRSLRTDGPGHRRAHRFERRNARRRNRLAYVKHPTLPPFPNSTSNPDSIPTSRVDYTNIDEAIEDVDDPPTVHRGASTRFLVPKIHTEDDDDYDDDEEEEEEEGDSSSRVAPSQPSPSPSPPHSSDSPPAWTDANKEELYAYVMKHFPEFAPNKVLRFSRLFGAAKSLSRPEIWASAAKRRRARHGDDDDDDDVTTTTTEPKCWRIDEDGEKEFFLSSPPALPPEMFAPGNEAKFHQCLDETKRHDNHSTSGGDRGGDVTIRGSGSGKENHWRHGPAKLIYDLAGIPEDATELDYGLKLKPVYEGEREKSVVRYSVSLFRTLLTAKRTPPGFSEKSRAFPTKTFSW